MRVQGVLQNITEYLLRWVKLVTGKFLFFSPNLVWLTIASLNYFLFPYDYEAARNLTNYNWIVKRFRHCLLMNTVGLFKGFNRTIESFVLT